MVGATAQTVCEDKPASSSDDDAVILDEAFDRELLSHLVRHAAREATASDNTIEVILGVTRGQLEVIASFVGLSAADLAASGGAPAPDDEQLMLRELLMQHRSQPGDIGEWLACIIARRAMEPNHLWEDLGLPERPDLTKLLLRHFQPLAANNTRNMRWKRFLYRAICESEGFSMCPSPTCDACSEFNICYSDDSGPTALARNGRDSKSLIGE
jgi:nitrogen fixation protein NifQ